MNHNEKNYSDTTFKKEDILKAFLSFLNDDRENS
jgi:hypothetical protein